MADNRGKLKNIPHACILSAPTMALAVAEAKSLAAQALCTGEGEKPCGLCRSCRKIESGIHPDVSVVSRIVDDKGKQKKQLLIDQIRAMSADACLLPNEAKHKVYILEDADTMLSPAQNAALKLLEEPPLGAKFLLCCENPRALLPTVRSRCAEFSVGQSKAGDGEKEEKAAAYVKAVASGDEAALLRWCSKNEGMDNAGALLFLENVRTYLAHILCGRETIKGLSREDMLRLAALSDKCTKMLQVNVSVKHIFGLLAVEAIADSGNRGQ